MNIADEGTSAHLKAGVQACPSVAQMDLGAVVGLVNECFERWGLPENIKIDNGYPFVNPKYRDVPTVAKLWWIGLGINVIQNTPRCPQQNGAVECLQGVMYNWSNAPGQATIEALQQRLDEESEFQRNAYRMPAYQYQTRSEHFAELNVVKRPYDPANFDLQRVYDYLSEQVWQRRVTEKGNTKFFSQDIYVGKKYARQLIYATFDPLERQWLFRKADGTLLKTSAKGVPTEAQIKGFALMASNAAIT